MILSLNNAGVAKTKKKKLIKTNSCQKSELH